LWTRALPNGELAVGTPALSGSPTSGTVYAVGSFGRLHALDASTGAISWSAQLADDFLHRESSVLVAEGLVLVHTGAHISAINASTHAVAWTHPFVQSARAAMAGLATDGTRVFAIDGCHLVALMVNTGALSWDQPIGPVDAQCFRGPPDSRFPVVVSGTVYAWTYDGLTAFDTATGTVRWRTSNNAGGTPVGIAATENWIVLTHRSGPLWIFDQRTGALLGRTNDELAAYSSATITGDLALLWNTSGRLVAVDLLTMEQVWSSAAVGVSGDNSRPAVNAGRIYVYASDPSSTQSRLVALGPP
jgi:outer membrane protein assembly factor BamB